MLQIRRDVATRYDNTFKKYGDVKMIDVLGDALAVLAERCNDTSMAYVTSILQIQPYSVADEPSHKLDAIERAEAVEVMKEALLELGVDSVVDA